MFTGEYHLNLDTKGRMMIPAKFREDGYSEFFLTRSLDGCLSLYAIQEWKKLEEKLQALPMTSEKARKLKRYILGSAVSVECDKQGRILIPQVLRDKAELEKDVMLVGEDSDEENDLTGPEMVKKLVEILMLNREQDTGVINAIKSALLEWKV